MSEPFLAPILNILITKKIKKKASFTNNTFYLQTVVQEMNKLGIIVDLSHTSVQVIMTMMTIMMTTMIMTLMMIMTDGSARA